jgi:hypothetical protein
LSLFEDGQYEYCDTFFIYLKDENRPTLDAVNAALQQLGHRCVVENVREDDGKFESATIKFASDCSAMDIVYVNGPEVLAQLGEIKEELRNLTLTPDTQGALKKMATCESRFDIFHFEEQNPNTEDEFLDPGGLLTVVGAISSTCDGVGYDPQSQDTI